MSKKEPTDDNIFYNEYEFLHNNVHYEAGWYFFDEELEPYGPFLDKKHCERGLQLYVKQLNDGVAPTQTKHIPIIGNDETKH